METQINPEKPKQFLERKMELQESTVPSSDYITKLQSSKQYRTVTKTEIQVMEQRVKPRNKHTHLWSITL